MTGPLTGLKVVEMAGLGPAPFCGMLLADMGADVLSIARPEKADGGNAKFDVSFDTFARGKQTLKAELRDPATLAAVLEIIAKSDALIEGFRPGVMERLGLGPEVCLAFNPRLVYGRMTGWGQTGPLAHAAGHDINYLALSGALHAIGPRGEKPTVPLNYIGDFGGGGMLLGFGLVCALLEAKTSGKGQVVDAAMTDGAALLSTMMYGMHAQGMWSNQRGENLLDGGAHFYDTYTCADGKHIAIGAIEPQFYALLMKLLGITDAAFTAQMKSAAWPDLKARLAALFATRSRAEWCELLEGTDACFAPVLDWDEAPAHAHNVARGTFVKSNGVVQPAPAPRFSRTVVRPQTEAVTTKAFLDSWGVSTASTEALAPSK
ncbi:MAG: CoA transferase [Pseudorhodobacter sp.]|nr:CoA transferase [Rhizobacter sp.]